MRQPPATADSRMRRSVSTLKRWLREPLLHFLLIGVVLFAVYAYINRGRIGIALPRQIVLSLDELATMEGTPNHSGTVGQPHRNFRP